MHRRETDVLIVGAGPTGLMLANQLARRGVRVLIVDRHAGPAEQTRAIGVQARTLEIYDRLGIAGQALASGVRTSGANLWSRGKRQARIPVGDIGEGLSPFPFIFMLGQDENERILGAKLREQGCAVEWRTELLDLAERTDRVIATVRRTDGSVVEITAAWVAGCDGARSTVRERCGITFPGAPYEHVFYVADTAAHGPMVPHELNVYLWRDGFHLFFPMKGENRWRVIGILPPALRGDASVGFEQVTPHVRAAVGEQLRFEACHWFSTYRIHHRSASRFRAGRCFLLGDAAHIHSPMGAQGMNTGLQDAYNLAWKLALVVGGRADPALLDTYESERLPVARRLLHTTDRAFRLVVSDTRLAGLLRTRILGRVAAFAMRRPRVRQLAFRTISQIGIRYPNSELSLRTTDLPGTAPRAGDRFPWLRVELRDHGPKVDLFGLLDDTRFTLLEFGGAGGAAASVGQLPSLVRYQRIPASADNAAALRHAGAPAEGCYLLRPDGHIALAATRLDASAIARYFERIGVRASPASSTWIQAPSL